MTFNKHIMVVLCSWGFLLSQNVSIILHYFFFKYIFGPHLATHEYCDDVSFCKFRHQLLHSSLKQILESLRPDMTMLEVVHFPDGHFRKTIYGLGAYIADYSEQALLACVMQGWCPKYGFPLLKSCSWHILSDVLPLWMTSTLVSMDGALSHILRC